MHIAFVTEHVATFATNIKFNEGIYLLFLHRALASVSKVICFLIWTLITFFIMGNGWQKKVQTSSWYRKRWVFALCCIAGRNAVILPCGIYNYDFVLCTMYTVHCTKNTILYTTISYFLLQWNSLISHCRCFLSFVFTRWMIPTLFYLNWDFHFNTKPAV